ncbi:MAG: putative DNA-binding protein [Eubacteriales bacterium]|nr:putative DNA-binding protein [Eubacteriales bacterium]
MQSKLSNLEINIQMNWLLDFYGGLLTEKQQEILGLYYEEDFSLAEIAEQCNVSRQNIHDIIQRATRHLQNYEEALHLVERTLQASERLNQALQSLQEKKYTQTAQYIENAIGQLEGE